MASQASARLVTTFFVFGDDLLTGRQSAGNRFMQPELMGISRNKKDHLRINIQFVKHSGGKSFLDCVSKLLHKTQRFITKCQLVILNERFYFELFGLYFENKVMPQYLLPTAKPN